jgi:hypothetical protein
MPFPIHPHMLRHACGFKLANDGHDTRALQHYLGHKNIQHTVRYSEMAPDRFKDFWRGYWDQPPRPHAQAVGRPLPHHSSSRCLGCTTPAEDEVVLPLSWVREWS